MYESGYQSVMIMAAPRNLVGDAGRKDEENAKVEEEEEDWSTGKKPKSERLPLTRWEVAAAVAVVLIFCTGLFCIYLTMPAADYGKLKLPRTIADLRLLKYVPNGSLNLVPILKFKSLIFSCLWIFSNNFVQRSSCIICTGLSSTIHSGLLFYIHLHANFYDSWNNFYVIASWSPVRCCQRPSLSCLQCHSWSIFLLLFVQVNWQAFS